MANEEQRRAFESYMGRTGGSGSNGQGQDQGQPIPQYPGSFARPGNSYLYNVRNTDRPHLIDARAQCEGREKFIAPGKFKDHRTQSVAPSANETFESCLSDFRAERQSEEAEARLMSHPRPYRQVVPEQRSFLKASDETSSNADSVPRRRVESPSRSILKPLGTERETSHRRRNTMRESQQSMHVEVGGPRVHFGGGRRQEEPVLEPRGRSRYADERLASGDKYEHYREYSRHRVVDDPPPEPLAQDFERIRIRHSSPSPRREYEEEIRIDRQRRISPSPPPPSRRFEEVRVRNVSPLPARRPPGPHPLLPRLNDRRGHCFAISPAHEPMNVLVL
ncbi:hypothetical protein J4E91_002560 [Alternaria rosae]|nr:hypothetical protein J4E91_002560 [Alternaria rosae]